MSKMPSDITQETLEKQIEYLNVLLKDLKESLESLKLSKEKLQTFEEMDVVLGDRLKKVDDKIYIDPSYLNNGGKIGNVLLEDKWYWVLMKDETGVFWKRTEGDK